jgi:hypothetical protein
MIRIVVQGRRVRGRPLSSGGLSTERHYFDVQVLDALDKRWEN